MLDDLGAERTTDWVEETMNLIVNTRYNDRRPTIFTSNYEDVPDTDDLDSLLVRVGFRMHSRLREMCEFLEYGGPDYRDFEYPPSSEDLFRRWKSQPRRRLPRRTSVRARAQLKEGQSRPGLVGRQGIELTVDGRPSTVDGLLGLYLHIPFCESICNYCNFNRGLLDPDAEGSICRCPGGRDSSARATVRRSIRSISVGEHRRCLRRTKSAGWWRHVEMPLMLARLPRSPWKLTLRP